MNIKDYHVNITITTKESLIVGKCQLVFLQNIHTIAFLVIIGIHTPASTPCK